MKPTALVMDAIKDCSHRGDIVLDAFSGSGTTIIAAQQCGHRADAWVLEIFIIAHGAVFLGQNEKLIVRCGQAGGDEADALNLPMTDCS